MHKAQLPSLVSPCLHESRYVARLVNLDNREEIETFQKLRHGYFVQDRRWIAPCENAPGCESDDYDAHALHLAVFEGQEIVAYLRALPWRQGIGFMLEHDFRCLLPDEALDGLHRQHSVEISRLVLAPKLSPDAVLPVTELLFKLLYQFCRQHGIEHLYAVIEPRWLRRFQRCFHLPFQALGAVQRFPDGTRAVAAHACLRELEQSLQDVDPLRLRWYQTP